MIINTIIPGSEYDIAVILINYNSSQYTIDCIASVLQKTSSDISYGIVVIDNASEVTDYENLTKGLSPFKDKLPVTVFRSRINTGFSAGNMMGVQLISAKYYFFLNNDCTLQNDCLSILYNFCEEHQDAALCSPQLYNEAGKHQPCFDYFPYLITKIFGLAILRLSYGKRFIKRKGIYDSPVRVDVVSGSQMFIRSEVFNVIGGFDTTFFLYCEEEDIALKVFNKGYRAYLVPEAKNIHKGGASTKASLAIRKEFYISFLYFYRKHFGYFKQQSLKFILALRLLRKGFSSLENLRLCLFVISGAHSKHSLKHKQQLQKSYKLQD